MQQGPETTRIAVVGAGHVGATFAYALLLSGLAAEIVLIDANRKRSEGEAMDLNHAVPFAHQTRIWAGDYADCGGAAITVIAAGAAQKAGETRLDLVQRNVALMSKIVPQVVKDNPAGILLVAANPVDILTYAAWKLSRLPATRVMGSGTVLDTARFHYLLGRHFQVDARSVHGYIIGEHGDSEVPVWSLANIAGMRLPEFCAAHGMSCSKEDMDQIFHDTRDAAYEIISRKGSTHYAVAAGLVRIVESILRDQHTVLSVSTLIEGYYGIDDVCLSLPSVLGKGGAERVLRLDLSDDELDALRCSANILKATLAELKLT